jgi:SAM-dependent methyltransferase
MEQSRKYFFSDLRSHLIKLSIEPDKDIRSVFEVGCSLGYQLRYMEMDLFPLADVLEGIDIDKYAIRAGSEYLKSIGSKVRLSLGDMEELSNFIGGKAYDVIVCSGVLMYLNEQTATKVVRDMLRYTHIMLAISGPAHPSADNCQLQHSVPRVHDGAFIHNVDDMVKKAGGRILARRWEGGNMVGGHTIYFIFATKQ